MLMAIMPEEFHQDSYSTFEFPTWFIVLLVILGIVLLFMFFILSYGFIYFNFIWEPGAEIPKILKF